MLSQLIDKFFDLHNLQTHIEQSIDDNLVGTVQSRLVLKYDGPAQLYTPQTVTDTQFAGKDSFPWIVELGDHLPMQSSEYWWVNNAHRPSKNVRVHMESGKLSHGVLEGNYAGIHLQTEGIPKNSQTEPSWGNMSVKIIICDFDSQGIFGYRRDHDKRMLGSKRHDYRKILPSEYLLKNEYVNIPIHMQRKS